MRRTFFVMSFLLMSSLALAALPNYMTVQGRLTDSNNVPVPSGSYIFNFTIWNDPTAGALIWTDQFNAPVSNGVFNIELGRNVPLNIPFDQPYFLEVRVGGNLLTPRVNFTSAPYAFTAGNGGGGTPGGSSGQFQYNNGGGGFGGASNLCYDTANNRVGIGTCTPNAKLEISISASTGLSFNATGDLFVNATSSNVGIGTANPSHALNIIGGLNVTSPAFFGGSVSLTGSNLLMNSNNILNVNQINGIAVSNFLTTSTSFSGDVSGIYSNLQLGSGTVTNPDIANSAVNRTQLTGVLPINLASDVTGTLPIGNGGTGATTAANARTSLVAAMAGSCPGQAIQNATANGVQCVAIGGGGGGNGWITSGNYIYNATTAGVGIGTATPEEKLHIVNSSTNGNVYLKIQSTTCGDIGIKLQRGSTSDTCFDYNAYASGGNFYIDASQSGSTLHRVFIDTSGDVGIGTTSPYMNLEVNGGIRLNTTTAKPTCIQNITGTFWFTPGASGVADILQMCAKNAGGTYGWRNITLT